MAPEVMEQEGYFLLLSCCPLTLTFAFCLLPFAFRLSPFAFRLFAFALLPFAFQLLPGLCPSLFPVLLWLLTA